MASWDEFTLHQTEHTHATQSRFELHEGPEEQTQANSSCSSRWRLHQSSTLVNHNQPRPLLEQDQPHRRLLTLWQVWVRQCEDITLTESQVPEKKKTDCREQDSISRWPLAVLSALCLMTPAHWEDVEGGATTSRVWIVLESGAEVTFLFLLCLCKSLLIWPTVQCK